MYICARYFTLGAVICELVGFNLQHEFNCSVRSHDFRHRHLYVLNLITTDLAPLYIGEFIATDRAAALLATSDDHQVLFLLCFAVCFCSNWTASVRDVPLGIIGVHISYNLFSRIAIWECSKIVVGIVCAICIFYFAILTYGQYEARILRLPFGANACFQQG